MTTPSGQDPRSGPTRGGPARPSPRGADPGVGGGPTGGRTRGSTRADSDPWGSPGTPERGRDGQPAGDRTRTGQGWGGQGGRGAAGRLRSGSRRGHPGADGESSGWDGNRPAADSAGGGPGSPRPGFLRWIGGLPTSWALYILGGFTVVGVLGTLLSGSEPGFLLGLLITVGSVISVIAIQRRSMYLLIPLPTLLFFITAVLTGAVHDSSVDTSKSDYGVSFLQWIAGVFFGMCIATILVVVICAGRWLFSLSLVSGQFAMSANRGGAGRGPRNPAATGPGAARDRRPPRDPERWVPSEPWGDRGGSAATRANRPKGDNRDSWGDRDNAAGQRTNRGPGDSRDPWGDRAQPGRQPTDRDYPGGQQPGGSSRPADRALPPGRDQGGQRDQRDSRDPWGPSSQRTNRDRRDPGDPWGQRLASTARASRGGRSGGPGA